MATLAQIEANRRNSQKSTGPRTDAGKTASSQNATRSGLYAASLLIDGDDPAELDALAREYRDTCRPVGPRERAVVDSLLHTDWLLRRMRRLETQLWNSQAAHLRKVEGDEFEEEFNLLNVYRYIEDRLERIQRRITTLERLYHRRLAELDTLQSQRPPSPDPPPVAARDPEIGFVPPVSPPPSEPLPVAPSGPGIGFVPSARLLRVPGRPAQAPPRIRAQFDTLPGVSS